MTTIDFVLNGRPVSVPAGGDPALIHALRNDLGHTGTRFGCGLEQCGACVVHVDGAPAFACTLPLSSVAGRTVATAEGLTDDPVGAALLAALAEERAGQCGFCLSGILMAATALLRTAPRADRATICAALDGHLCRCGAHPAILRAIERAGASLSAGSP